MPFPQNVMRLHRTLTVAFGLFLLAACNPLESTIENSIENETGGDAEVDMNADGTTRIETDEGTFTSGQDVPDNWPKDVEIYAGSTVQYSATMEPKAGQKGGSVLVLQTSDNDEVVSEHYVEALKAAGWEVEAEAHAAGLTTIGGTKDGRNLAIMVATQEGKTMITLTIENEE